MYYTQEYRTKWHDTDAQRHVRPSQILMYMQETANLHMIHAGQSLDQLRDEQGLAFILTRLSMELLQPLYAHEEIRVRTWISPGKGVNYPRYFSLEKADGEVVARACSHWVLIDLNTHLPCRSDQYGYNYTPEEPLSLTPPRRFVVPDVMEQVGERRIVYSDLDYNQHMNNTRYPDMICDFLPAQAIPHIRTMHLSYVREGAAGAVLRVMRGERVGEDGAKIYLVRTYNEDGELCLDAEIHTAPGC